MFFALLGGFEIFLILMGMALFVVVIAGAVWLAFWLSRRAKKKQLNRKDRQALSQARPRPFQRSNR